MASPSISSLILFGTLFSAILPLDGCLNKESPPKAKQTVQYGGMWIPGQLRTPIHQEQLRKLGFELPPSAFTDLQSYPLGAVANVGGCSASFVSESGLIVTNHHCVQKLLPDLSQAGENLLESGFIAYRKDQERKAAGFSGSVTLSSTDVTQRIFDQLLPSMNEPERRSRIAANQAALISECQANNPELACSVKSFYNGNRYELQTTQTLSDLRLVYVPPEGLGWFGGDTDNWRWPRHTTDFAFLRAYGPDGRPLKPKQVLRIASKRIAPQDPVMIAGYPGRTFRFDSGAQVKFVEEHFYPYLLDRSIGQIQVLDELISKSPEIEPELKARRFNLSNGRTNLQATLEGLKRSRFSDERLGRDALLEQWIFASPETSARFGSVVKELAELTFQNVQSLSMDQDIQQLAYRTGLLRLALRIVSAARARAAGMPTTAEQVARFREELQSVSGSRAKVPGLEEAEVGFYFVRLSKYQAQGASQVRAMLGLAPSAPLEAKGILKNVDEIYGSTMLKDLELASTLFERAPLEVIRLSKDGVIRAALALDEALDRMDAASPSDPNQIRRLRRLYTQARLEYAQEQNQLLAPDANRSLRISYGKIQGYRSLDQNFFYPPFSTGAELLAKHTGQDPFDLPETVEDALKSGDFGRYLDPRLGDIPVNFLSTTDATGGNSGSATLNGQGELVGLLFDGNYEGVMSDLYLDPELARSIHVDMRFVLWILDSVIPSHRLLKEMGIKPRTQSVSARHYRFSQAASAL